jgi:hypothetical protein
MKRTYCLHQILLTIMLMSQSSCARHSPELRSTPHPADPLAAAALEVSHSSTLSENAEQCECPDSEGRTCRGSATPSHTVHRGEKAHAH